MIPTTDELFAKVPATYQALLTRKPCTAAEAWLNHLVASMVDALPPSQGFYSRPSVARNRLVYMLGIPKDKCLEEARREMGAGLASGPSPDFRLKARDQGSGRGFLLEVGYLEPLFRLAEEANLKNHDQWVEDAQGREVDRHGVPTSVVQVIGQVRKESTTLELLARATAALERPGDLSDDDRRALLEELSLHLAQAEAGGADQRPTCIERGG